MAVSSVEAHQVTLVGHGDLKVGMLSLVIDALREPEGFFSLQNACCIGHANCICKSTALLLPIKCFKEAFLDAHISSTSQAVYKYINHPR